MFELLWNFYCVFSIFLAININVNYLWKYKPKGFSETLSECKNWLFTQLCINKFNIHIEQFIMGFLLIFPLSLSMVFYFLVSIITGNAKNK